MAPNKDASKSGSRTSGQHCSPEELYEPCPPESYEEWPCPESYDALGFQWSL